MKPAILFTVILFIALMNNATSAQNHLIGETKDFSTFAKNVSCTITLAGTTIHRGAYPVFTVELLYRGTAPATFCWDNNFGRVLWNGQIIMIAQSAGWKETTESLKMKTSNTYEPRKRLTLKKGVTLKSYLDFSTLPVRSVAGIFPKLGKVKIGLYVKTETPEGFRYIPISNTVTVTFKK